MSLIGELLLLQLRHSPDNKNRTDKYFRRANAEAFVRYYRKAPYLEGIISIMNMNQHEDVGPLRLCSYLAAKHKHIYVDVAKRNSLSVTGIMYEVESMMQEC